MLTVSLYKVGRNLNRCYRACHSAGVTRMELIDCTGEIEGNLYSAAGKVDVVCVDSVPHRGTVCLEVDGDVPIDEVDWSGVQRIVVGGENVTLPRVRSYGRVRIPTANSLCLTTEAALSIGLYACEVNEPLSSPKNWRYVGYGLYACAIPRRCDVEWMARRGIRTLIDLTQRERATVRRACDALNISYLKVPTPYDANPVMPTGFDTPAVVCCFHGRDRTGHFIRQWREAHQC